MKIVCESLFCIYYEEDHCTLDSITIDERGMCEDMIYMDIDEKYLLPRRKKLRNELEKRNKLLSAHNDEFEMVLREIAKRYGELQQQEPQQKNAD